MLSFELRWAAAIARSCVPASAMGGLTADLDLTTRFHEDCKLAPWHANVVLRLAVWITWLSPLWLQHRFKTFGALAEAEREPLLERLFTSPVHLVRLTMLYMKLMSMALLLGDRRVLARVGAYRLEQTEPQAQAPIALGTGTR